MANFSWWQLPFLSGTYGWRIFRIAQAPPRSGKHLSAVFTACGEQGKPALLGTGGLYLGLGDLHLERGDLDAAAEYLFKARHWASSWR